jgi:2-methylcitrate dehydratase PrpD
LGLIEDKLAEFIVDTKLVDIPSDVVEFTKQLIMKTVAGMVSGSTMPTGKKTVAFVRSLALPPEVGVIASKFKTGLYAATFANAIFAHACELEDDRIEPRMGVAWDITAIPVAFPLAEYMKLSGKELVEAVAVGLEVHSRFTLFPTEHLGTVVWPGAYASAVVAAKVFGLDYDEVKSLLGFAWGGVGIDPPLFGTDAHFFQSALQCIHGLLAADLVKRGWRTTPNLEVMIKKAIPPPPIPGVKIDPAMVIEDLGKKWRLKEIGIKKYPCCFWMHRHIDALIELVKEHNIKYEDVESVEVDVGPVEGPVTNRPDPKDTADAMFSFQQTLAAALIDRDVTHEHLTIEAIRDPRFAALRRKVKVNIHSDWEPVQFSGVAKVTVRLKDGRVLSRERVHIRGGPREPLTWDEFKTLYKKFTKGILPDDVIEFTCDAIYNLEKLKDLGELINALVFGRLKA